MNQSVTREIFGFALGVEGRTVHDGHSREQDADRWALRIGIDKALIQYEIPSHASHR